MYELKLSKLYSKQIKKIAQKSQSRFLDICKNWDMVHKIANELGKKGNPFQEVKFAVKVNGTKLYLVYNLIEDKKELWVSLIVVKSKNKFVTYYP